MGVLDVVQLALLTMPVVFALGFWRSRRRRLAKENEGEAAVRTG
jgi:hypothetical protein